jgi:hypothetical protein
MVPLQRTLTWYQDARATMQSTRSVLNTDLDRGEMELAHRVLERAFDAARARAAILAEDRPGGPTTPSRHARADRRAQLTAAIERDELEVARLKARLRAATASTRPALERELAVASNRLGLGRFQLDFVTKRLEMDSAGPDDEVDLTDQIQALQDTVPELSPAAPAPTNGMTAPRVTLPAGALGLVSRVLTLQGNRSALQELTHRTTELDRDVKGELQATRQTVRPMMARLRELAKDPAVDGASLAAGQQEFRDLLGRAQLLGAVVLPLREESALLRRYAAEVETWRRALDREVGHVLRGLAVQLAGVVVALGAIFVGSVLWRIAAVRYVANAYHRRLLLTARHVLTVAAIALVLVFHFASELTAVVAALGFAAAGIAFALQNVILAVAGYFSMVAPNGIRVGDRVSLQGAFGYVHGEVMEIGVVRTRLRELAGEPLQPTGRIMVFPNSVAFTGSFIKHPPPEAYRPS